MPRLDVYVDFKRFLSIKLKDKSIRVGRSPSCDIQLASEKVSRHHSSITPTGDGSFWIEDMSTNGTRVNSEMVRGRKVLAPGDRIYIDQYILVFQIDDTERQSVGAEDTIAEDETQLV